MKLFAELINALDSTNKTLHKIEALKLFFQNANPKDQLWLLALFTGKKPKRLVNTTLLKQWVIELANIPEWLFIESYAAVGDLGETISLLLPPNNVRVDRELWEWMEQIHYIQTQSESDKKDFVLHSWKSLSTIERFIFNKLIGGNFRVGVSNKILLQAFADFYQKDINEITHAIMGEWNPTQNSLDDIINSTLVDTSISSPYPFCLAYSLDKDLKDLGSESNWMAEYKWDGIRGQIIKRDGEIFIWSRGEELVTKQFPELIENMISIPGDWVMDGEILVQINNTIQDFSALQKRLNRKSISKKILIELPIVFIAYDLLEWQRKDIRNEPLKYRRQILSNLINSNDSIVKFSEEVPFNEWNELVEIKERARSKQAEGLMLKNVNGLYHMGRKKGDWWKWKVNPLTIDAVLIYAQKGSGRRSGFYTDYTFAVRDGDKLVTVTKAYSGLTDKEIQEVSKFVNKHAKEKFGPVRTVEPILVFEIAFEGIAFSNRHKSGVALRFPRIQRWRKDKTVKDIDTLDALKKLIEKNHEEV